MKDKIVSFDFDDTLSKNHVQKYAKELIIRGVEVWIVTSRYDELHKHLYKSNPTLNDLWIVCDDLNIPRHRVRFTCMKWKGDYLKDTNVIWHLDDNHEEFKYFNKIKTTAIQVNSGNWKHKCEKLLNYER